MASLASRTLFVVLSSPPTVLDFCGGCAVPCLLSLALGWVRFWPAVSTAPVRCEVCSLGCPSWLVLLFMSLLSFTCSCGGMVWSQVCGPSCCSCVLGSLLRRSVTLAYGRTLSFSGFPLGFLPLAFVRTWVGRLRFLPSFGGDLSFPCPGCFSLAFPTVWLSRLLEFFLELFPGVLSSRFRFLLIARGGCG